MSVAGPLSGFGLRRVPWWGVAFVWVLRCVRVPAGLFVFGLVRTRLGRRACLGPVVGWVCVWGGQCMQDTAVCTCECLLESGRPCVCARGACVGWHTGAEGSRALICRLLACARRQSVT